MSAAINTGGPAFPFVEPETPCNVTEGMTLRDYFAAKAMAAHITRHPVDAGGTDYPFDDTMAEWAYAQADAMLRAREVAKADGGAA